MTCLTCARCIAITIDGRVLCEVLGWTNFAVLCKYYVPRYVVKNVKTESQKELN